MHNYSIRGILYSDLAQSRVISNGSCQLKSIITKIINNENHLTAPQKESFNHQWQEYACEQYDVPYQGYNHTKEIFIDIVTDILENK